MPIQANGYFDVCFKGRPFRRCLCIDIKNCRLPHKNKKGNEESFVWGNTCTCGFWKNKYIGK